MHVLVEYGSFCCTAFYEKKKLQCHGFDSRQVLVYTQMCILNGLSLKKWIHSLGLWLGFLPRNSDDLGLIPMSILLVFLFRLNCI